MPPFTVRRMSRQMRRKHERYSRKQQAKLAGAPSRKEVAQFVAAYHRKHALGWKVARALVRGLRWLRGPVPAAPAAPATGTRRAP